MILPHVDILIHAHDQDAPFHTPARAKRLNTEIPHRKDTHF